MQRLSTTLWRRLRMNNNTTPSSSWYITTIHFHLGFIPTNIINIYQIIMFKVTYPEDDSDKSLPSPSSSILINFKFCLLISRLLPARNTLIRCPYCVVHALSKLNAAGVFFPRWSRLEHSSLLPIKSCRPSVQTSYSTLERAFEFYTNSNTHSNSNTNWNSNANTNIEFYANSNITTVLQF